ncbi:hypothetical protein Nepgr_003757 [Nepenthes gracilis]|uniref:non-specific serine/threonine protein kinase n=1 Tax=Nepenthes gracilis TaxID=150966 RepID=A0AAD3XE45_NEPGR|nr:hypothetical protein Nepgr_003757 [Nepenthes gracilis]
MKHSSLSAIAGPSFHPLMRSLSLLIFLLLPYDSLSLDPGYQACTPRKCGNLNITYPFYIQGLQPSYCGYPGFQISCQNNSPTLNLSNGDSYTVGNISYGNQSLSLTNSAFLYFNCGYVSSIHNLTADMDYGNFKFVSNSSLRWLSLLHGCSKSVAKRLSNFTCIGGNGNRTIWAAYDEDGDWKEEASNCTSVVSVPYEGEGGSDIKGVLRRGITLNWTADNCTVCYESGGRCGFNYNVSQFQCFCPDRPHEVSCKPTRKSKLGLILGIVIPGGIIMVVALISLWNHDKLKLGSTKLSRSISSGVITSDLDGRSRYFGVPVFSHSDLEEATNNFDPTRELGNGGSGTVYQGKLKDGREVAVKRLYQNNYKQVERFMNEVEILARLRHQNLVTLYGCTSRRSHEQLLVYEYVPNGTVADHLHGDRAKSESLTWPIRMRIGIETAAALSYLHASDIIHRDVKTGNVLLDNNFHVKVGDFGLSRLFPTHITHISTVPQGTPGYLDPEYYRCYQLTTKSDVFSFGVVLIELISSLPAVDICRNSHEINLSDYAMSRIQRCRFNELVDLRLGFESNYEVKRMTTSVAELAFQCLQQDKELRPSMDEVLEALKRIESADYEALEVKEMNKNDGESDRREPNEGLLKNVQQASSPNSVMGNWVSRSTTPGASC